PISSPPPGSLRRAPRQRWRVAGAAVYASVAEVVAASSEAAVVASGASASILVPTTTTDATLAGATVAGSVPTGESAFAATRQSGAPIAAPVAGAALRSE